MFVTACDSWLDEGIFRCEVLEERMCVFKVISLLDKIEPGRPEQTQCLVEENWRGQGLAAFGGLGNHGRREPGKEIHR